MPTSLTSDVEAVVEIELLLRNQGLPLHRIVGEVPEACLLYSEHKPEGKILACGPNIHSVDWSCPLGNVEVLKYGKCTSGSAELHQITIGGGSANLVLQLNNHFNAARLVRLLPLLGRDGLETQTDAQLEAWIALCDPSLVEQHRVMFEHHDQNKDGWLSPDEVRRALGEVKSVYAVTDRMGSGEKKTVEIRGEDYMMAGDLAGNQKLSFPEYFLRVCQVQCNWALEDPNEHSTWASTPDVKAVQELRNQLTAEGFWTCCIGANQQKQGCVLYCDMTSVRCGASKGALDAWTCALKYLKVTQRPYDRVGSAYSGYAIELSGGSAKQLLLVPANRANGARLSRLLPLALHNQGSLSTQQDHQLRQWVDTCDPQLVAEAQAEYDRLNQDVLGVGLGVTFDELKEAYGNDAAVYIEGDLDNDGHLSFCEFFRARCQVQSNFDLEKKAAEEHNVAGPAEGTETSKPVKPLKEEKADSGSGCCLIC